MAGFSITCPLAEFDTGVRLHLFSADRDAIQDVLA
jgi:hypothetical protein